MKVVKSFKGLKKWAKTTFIALLTICIITTTTGVGSLIAYADPNGEPDTTLSTDPATTPATPPATDPVTTPDPDPATDPTTDPDPDTTTSSGTGSHTHSYTVIDKAPFDESYHAVVQTCSCTDEITTYEPHNMVDGVCTECNYRDLSYVPNDNNNTDNSSNTGSGTRSGGTSTAGDTSGTDNQVNSNPDYGMMMLGAPMTLGAPAALGSPSSGDWATYYNTAPSATSSPIYNPVTAGSDSVLFNDGTKKDEYSVSINTRFVPGVYSEAEFEAGSPVTASYNAVGTYKRTYVVQSDGVTVFTGVLYNYLLPKDISDVDVTKSQQYYPDTNQTDLGAGYHGTALSEGVDYTVDRPFIVDDGGPVSLTLTGTGNYTGVTTTSFSGDNGWENVQNCDSIPTVSVTFEGVTTQLTSYTDSVEIGAENGFQVATSPTGTFANTITISRAGANQNVTLYFKKATGNTVIRKTITNLTITDSFPVKYDGSLTKRESYVDKVAISADGYMVSTAENGPFSSEYIYDKVGENQNFYLWFTSAIDPTQKIRKLITDITIVKGDEASIPIRYDGSETKKSSYVDKVAITAQGYLIGTSADGPFNKQYVHRKTGKDQNFYLYFVDANNPSATPVKKLITDITIIPGAAEADEGAPTGYIKVDTYASDKLAKEQKTVYLTQEKKTIEIYAVDDDGSPVNIEYFTSENYYETRSEIEGAVTEAADPNMDKSRIDKDARWKTYYSDGKPTLTENTGVYIYAKVSDESGNTRYLSTGRIIYDTKAPTVNTILLAEGNTDMLTVMTGKDNLSGIYRFYLRYIEKDKKDKTPTALEIIGDNWYVENLTGDELAAGGSFKMPSLDPKKTYIFYGVAIDKAGNISEVKEYETKGKASADNSASKNSIDDPNSGSGSGLTPAPNGIAGSGTPEPKPKTTPSSDASSAAGTTDASASGTGSASAPAANPVPYIADATGDTRIGLTATGGWDKIESEVTKALDGTRMSVEMSGSTVIPDSMVRTLKDKDVSVTLKMPDGIEWIIRGEDVSQAKGLDIDLRVRRDAGSIPERMLNDIAGDQLHTEIDIAHAGDFGFEGTLRVPFGESNAGKYGNLYYYDTEAGELRLLQTAKIGNDGYAEYKLDHASNYSVIINTVNMAETLAKRAQTPVNTLDYSKPAGTALSLLPEDGRSIMGMRIWLFVVAIICAVMCLAILLVPSFRHEKENYEQEIW
ncbi:MAG: hypothetical protein K5673_06070 [Lachnospiraceae bacterium]|nr:hypothetical protein [Lachnospiraceae bacterium]